METELEQLIDKLWALVSITGADPIWTLQALDEVRAMVDRTLARSEWPPEIKWW